VGGLANCPGPDISDCRKRPSVRVVFGDSRALSLGDKNDLASLNRRYLQVSALEIIMSTLKFVESLGRVALPEEWLPMEQRRYRF
jgi:hypothetical protein